MADSFQKFHNAAMWADFNQRIEKVYLMHIRVPTAPLEVNIPATVRERINQNLKAEANAEGLFDIPPSPALNSMSAEDVELFVKSRMTVYDEASEIVSKIIETDIFPRFKKSPYFKTSEAV